MPFQSATQVHSKRRTKLTHDRMRDLVFVKFNSLLRHKKNNKIRDPLEKEVGDILEDGDNEFITGVAPNAEQGQDPEAEGEKEQDGVQAQQVKRKRPVRPKKRTRRIIDITECNEDEPELASSSDTEDDHDVDMAGLSDHSSESHSEKSMSDD
jgi:hypothetical protein